MLKRQVCPLCGAENPLNETVCALCGARLTGRPQSALALEEEGSRPAPFYDPALGEDDLLTTRPPLSAWLTLSLLLAGFVVAGVAFVWFARPRLASEALPSPTVSLTPSQTPTPDFTLTVLALTPSLTPFPSATRTPPPPLPTVTPPPPPPPTPSPCIVTVAQGDTLYGLALACGHRDYAVVPFIVETNNLSCETCIQVGQTLEIPLPTPTFDPAAPPSGVGAVSLLTSDGLTPPAEVTVRAEDRIATLQANIEPTMNPGLQFHIVQKGETMIDVIALYNIDVKLLSEINPEIDFPQCDFGMRFGGPTCAVFFFEGQRVRVPAPTPTPTIQPTLSGSETPTPTATPTINIPSAFGPAEGEEFDAASLVTLRWSTTGTLGLDEAYWVQVTHQESGTLWSGLTCDLSFEVPIFWQADAETFQTYTWTVSIVDVIPFPVEAGEHTLRRAGFDLCRWSFALPLPWGDNPAQLSDVLVLSEITPADPRYTTPARRFLWQGRPRSKAP